MNTSITQFSQLAQYAPYILAFFGFLLAMKLLKWVVMGLVLVLAFSSMSSIQLPSVSQIDWKSAATVLMSSHETPKFQPTTPSR